MLFANFLTRFVLSMTSNVHQINPIPLTSDLHFDEDSLDIQASIEHVHSSSFGDNSLLSGSTRATSPECSPENSGKYLTAHWQSQRHPCPNVGNTEEPDMFRFCEQRQYNANDITSFSDNGGLGDMRFDMTFGIENSTVPYQDPIEINEEDQVNLEPSEQFSTYTNYGNHAGPCSNAVQIFPSVYEAALPYDSQQNQIYDPPSSVPPLISISHEPQEAVIQFGDYSYMNPSLSQSLPIRDAATRVCKPYDMKISKSKTPQNRSRSNSLSTKANRPGGRTHKMSFDECRKYSEVRKMGACTNCRIRKCGVSQCFGIVCF